jgi:hypothetical protein
MRRKIARYAIKLANCAQFEPIKYSSDWKAAHHDATTFVATLHQLNASCDIMSFGVISIKDVLNVWRTVQNLAAINLAKKNTFSELIQ